MKHIHFIGICGVAMSALALAFHKNGWKVTGSDKGFYPPVSTNLNNAGIAYYPGWHPEKMTADGNPDVVIVGNVAGSNNPEWLYVQEHNISYMSYPEAVAKYIIAQNSIVCAGTFGKTTTATILSWIMQYANMPANHMFGGIALSDIAPANIKENARWSVVEGDEYKTSRWDQRAKFYHYSPTHLLLTAAVWDHADVYPTEESYNKAFKDLVGMIPKTGVLVANADEPTVVDIISHSEFRILNTKTYGGSDDVDYQYKNIEITKDGITFDIQYIDATTDKKITTSSTIRTQMLGDFTAKNMTGAFAMAHQIGIAPETIAAALKEFLGVRRRLERRHKGTVDVYDDIAHSPTKAIAVLKSLRELYDGKIYAVYEPNTGNRKEESVPAYDNAFKDADEVIVGRLTNVKIAPDDPSPPFDGERLSQVIAHTHDHVHYIPDDDGLVIYLSEQTKKGDCVVFLGSHGFRGMIEQILTKLS